MEKSTLNYLIKHLTEGLKQYQDIDDLKNDLIAYSVFMADVYEQPTYFGEFMAIHKQYLEYLHLRKWNPENFSLFQKHLIYRCLFEGVSFDDLDLFVQEGLSDDEMEERYSNYFK